MFLIFLTLYLAHFLTFYLIVFGIVDLTFYLASYLICILTFFLALDLASLWRSIGHSIWHLA